MAFNGLNLVVHRTRILCTAAMYFFVALQVVIAMANRFAE